VEGLGMSPDVHYLAAEDAAAFAAQLDRLATDGVLWSELAERGRALVEERYSWAVAGEAFLALLARCGVEPTDRVP
jgi:glycosyltransferase involved in cell wall biosynthesis